MKISEKAVMKIRSDIWGKITVRVHEITLIKKKKLKKNKSTTT